MTNVPNMRFKEFEGEWKKTKLRNISEYVKDRTPTSSISTNNYVSTENLKQDFQGVIRASSVPLNVNVTSYSVNDVLFSNIRPYLKKVWKADTDGGCSPDVFVFRSKEACLPDFLYYLIANDDFINYVTTGSKGVKMPRGDKQQIEQYPISLPEKPEQSKIASLLALIDERISTQSQIIKDLKLLKCAIINKMFCSENNDIPQIRFPQYNVLWKKFKLKDMCKRVTTKNKSLTCTLVLTVAAQYGLINQETFFNKQIASDNLCNYYLLTMGDFAYNKSYSNNYPWGAIKRLDAFDNGVLSTLYICFRPNNEISSDFLAHYFETNKWYKGISDIAGEGARNHGLLNISIDDYFATSHKIPPIEEQRDIALFLNKLSSKLEIEEKQLQNYQYQKAYLLESLFI